MIAQLFLFWILFGILSAYFAHKRGRNPRYWFLIGLFFGLFGFLTLFFLPPVQKKSVILVPKTEPAPPKPIHSSLERPWFYVNIHQERQGPLYFSDLCKAHQNGMMNENSFVWNEGMQEWKKAADLPELWQELNRNLPT